ncbi:portal protein [Gordonia phage ObLaDi]|uniref:Portal protein n=2 Tax=Cafassovirus TaxID=3425056 RepID=A0A9E7QBU7_9CAUD|nr:portal protein [Gordonia phage Aleemily]UXE03727.1 portal protein [Gordonia phage ObLaDi]
MTTPQSSPAQLRNNALPDAGGTFPEEPFNDASEQMKVWDSWYTGDTERLSAHYSSDRAPMRPQQYQNGFRGRLARFFWGRPAEQATKRMHVPAPADLARTSADLLFAQPPKLVLPEGTSPKTQKRLDKLMGSPEVGATLLEAGELQSALGGVYMRLWWDKTVAPEGVQMASVAADCAVPIWRYGRLAGVTFWREIHRDRKGVYRHLERHTPGFIEHGLYFGTDGVLGTRVDLHAMPETAWVADIVDEDGVMPTGVKGLTAAYVPNVRPNRIWRNTPGLAPLGRSDFDGLEELFDALDHAYSSLMRDVDLGKARIFVDENMLANRGPGKGASFDLDQEVFTKLRGMGSAADASRIEVNQFAIRWQEHSQVCAEILNAILRGAGYSASNFADEHLTVSMTATEVESRDRLSERTRDKKINYWRAALGPLAKTMLEIDKIVFGTSVELPGEAPSVEFPIRPQQSQASLSQSLAALRAAQLISIEQGVRERNPNWSKTQIDEEVARIKDEVESQYAPAGPPPEFDPTEDPDPDDDRDDEPTRPAAAPEKDDTDGDDTAAA